MSKSENLYSAARELIPGGVNSPVRAFTGVGGTPLFIERADGAYLYDVDGKAYIDYVGSWGPMVLGHNHPAIRNAVIEAAQRGLSFGAPTEMEVKMAELVTELVPTMDMVRMVNSGTEATMRLPAGESGFRRADARPAKLAWRTCGFREAYPDLYLQRSEHRSRGVRAVSAGDRLHHR